MTFLGATENMKIAILTLPLHHNYGGILQAVALYQMLSEQGHEVTLLRKTTYYAPWKRHIISALKMTPGQNFREFRSTHLKSRTHTLFIEKNIPNRSPPLQTLIDVREYVEKSKFDCIVVGSDQVWRMEYINDGHYSTYFLDIETSKRLKRIAYAASFGTDYWLAHEKIAEVKNLLGRFDSISCREISGIELCDKTFDRGDAVQVLDPTLLWDKSFYRGLEEPMTKAAKTPYVLSYILDPSLHKKQLVLACAESVNHESVELLENGKYVTIGNWLRAFSNCEAVVTDSYHGVIFSIIYEKSFVAIVNSKRGRARFDSLLCLLDLADRLVDAEEFTKAADLINNPIDYKTVRERLTNLRDSSKDFLLGAISKNE